MKSGKEDHNEFREKIKELRLKKTVTQEQLAMADCLVSIGQYNEAIPYYRKALELQPAPRYTDAYLSIAQIHEIQENYEAAIQAWEGVLKLRQEEWNCQEGEAIDEPMREIARLREINRT